jgi:hypothetical protein
MFWTDLATYIFDAYLKTKAADPSKTMVTTYENTECHNPEDP